LVALDLKVFIARQDTTCSECMEALGRHAWIFLAGERGALCLSCADLDHLLFLPPGDAALTRRAHKHSTLSAVVLEWSRSRKRYERQGMLVEAGALEQAEKECLADQDARQRRQEREALRREEMDTDYVEKFARRVHELYPGCSEGRENVIAEHACQKYSGRVGRSASAKSLDAEAVRLAVIAHVRHAETGYDELLANGYERQEARAEVADAIYQILERWEKHR
jgi:hypothetical protein